MRPTADRLRPSLLALLLLGAPIGCDNVTVIEVQPDAGAPMPTPTGEVGPTGGTVDRLFFAFHGDSRPPNCDETNLYPTAIIQNIFKAEAAKNVQFALDLGDHMYVCTGGAQAAEAQMGFYMDAAKMLGKTLFMTMGNHECAGGGYCAPNSGDANSYTFRQALAPISKSVYYSFDVTTQAGLARFVIIADNSWDATEQQWLEDTLTKADKEAKYTIVARHHPIDNRQLSNPQEVQIIQSHKYSLFLTGHSHTYNHDTRLDSTGRTLRAGNGGAPLDNGGSYYGYGTVEQRDDDRLYVTMFDVASGQATDAFSVAPQ